MYIYIVGEHPYNGTCVLCKRVCHIHTHTVCVPVGVGNDFFYGSWFSWGEIWFPYGKKDLSWGV